MWWIASKYLYKKCKSICLLTITLLNSRVALIFGLIDIFLCIWMRINTLEITGFVWSQANATNDRNNTNLYLFMWIREMTLLCLKLCESSVTILWIQTTQHANPHYGGLVKCLFEVESSGHMKLYLYVPTYMPLTRLCKFPYVSQLIYLMLINVYSLRRT